MKSLFILIIVLTITVGCNGQPNTKTTFEIGMVNPEADKTYLVFMEFKPDSFLSRLVNDMDYLDPDVTDLDVSSTITNWHMLADTLVGEIEFQDQADTLYVMAGLVQVNNSTLKYSGMLTSFWSWLDVIETMNASFFIRRKP